MGERKGKHAVEMECSREQWASDGDWRKGEEMVKGTINERLNRSCSHDISKFSGDILTLRCSIYGRLCALLRAPLGKDVIRVCSTYEGSALEKL